MEHLSVSCNHERRSIIINFKDDWFPYLLHTTSSYDTKNCKLDRRSISEIERLSHKIQHCPLLSLHQLMVVGQAQTKHITAWNHNVAGEKDQHLQRAYLLYLIWSPSVLHYFGLWHCTAVSNNWTFLVHCFPFHPKYRPKGFLHFWERRQQRVG